MRLTIITINYNNASGLQKTMESVLNQTSKEFEYIIVDGAAPLNPPKGGLLKNPHPLNSLEGGTSRPVKQDIEVIEKFITEKGEKVNGFTRCTFLSPFGGVGGGFFSEPDNGIYHAMNKGIRMAKGEYIHFLNSGDWLVDEYVVEKMLNKINDSDILVGIKVSVRADGKAYVDNDKIKSVGFITLYKSTIQHPSAYIRRDLFNIYGMYDESLKIVSDWKWYLISVGLNNAKVDFADVYVTFFDTTGISCTNFALDKNERRQVLEELVPLTILADYDKYNFDIERIERLKKYPLFYFLFWVVERCLFKIEKWNIKYSRLKMYSKYKNN